MATLQQCILAAGAVAILAAAETGPRTGPRFRVDDPLRTEVPPHRVGDLQGRPVDELFDFLYQTFVSPRRAAEQQLSGGFGESADVNTLGDVPDGAWHVNRHYTQRMSLAELRRGPGNEAPPKGTLTVTAGKSDGVTPGLTIRDEAGRQYLLKFDAPDFPEMASGADVVGSKILYALGYYTPENYIVRFRPESLVVSPSATIKTADGHKQPLTQSRVQRLLRDQPRDKEGQYRALASRWVEGKTIGPFKYLGTRTDDPNDIVAHEDMRVLRGLGVIAAWINHTDTKTINSLDSVVEADGHRFIRHYLIDFGSCFGSDAGFPKLASRGHVYDIEPADMLKQSVSLGLYAPGWQRARTPNLRGVGRFEASAFEPRQWKPDYPNPAFLRIAEDDAFWAAKQVAAFTDEELHAMVETAEYSDPRATEYITRVLGERRDKIVATYLSGRISLDRFRIAGDRLSFDDLRPTHPASYNITWAAYDNNSGVSNPWPEASGSSIPESAKQLASGEFCVATVRDLGAATEAYAKVYLRRTGSAWVVVGIERSLPAKSMEKKGTA